MNVFIMSKKERKIFKLEMNLKKNIFVCALI